MSHLEETVSPTHLPKLHLLNSPYLESLSAPAFGLGRKLQRRIALGDDLYQAVCERKRAQQIIRELERRIATLSSQEETKRTPGKLEGSRRNSKGAHTSLPADVRELRQRWRDQEMRSLEEKKVRIKLENEEIRMRMDDLKEQLLQKKRVKVSQMNVLKLKESLLQERRLSPSKRQAQREREPRFGDLPEVREPPRTMRGADLRTSQSPNYDFQLRREKETLTRLNQKVTSTQISQLSQEEKTLKTQHSKKTQGTLLASN